MELNLPAFYAFADEVDCEGLDWNFSLEDKEGSRSAAMGGSP